MKILRLSRFLLAASILVLSSIPVWGQDLAAAEAPNPGLKIKLKRLVVGNQGAILKIWGEKGHSEPQYYRGIDDRDTAPYSAKDQLELMRSLEMNTPRLEQATIDIINGYNKMPKKNAIAFLGLVNSMPDTSVNSVSTETKAKIREFLLTRLFEDKSVIMRRQACLALAVSADTDAQTIESIISFYSQSQNLWETFPVQQFFEYHAKSIKELPNFAAVRDQVSGVDSLYRANILNYLDK